MFKQIDYQSRLTLDVLLSKFTNAEDIRLYITMQEGDKLNIHTTFYHGRPAPIDFSGYDDLQNHRAVFSTHATSEYKEIILGILFSRECKKIVTVRFSGIQFGTSGGSFDALKLTNIRYLQINACGFGVGRMAEFAKCLEVGFKQLISLEITNDSVDQERVIRTDDFITLCDGLKKNPSLTHFEFHGVERIHAESDIFVRTLCGLIKDSKTITTINYSKMSLTDDQLLLIGKSFQHNEKIRRLLVEMSPNATLEGIRRFLNETSHHLQFDSFNLASKHETDLTFESRESVRLRHSEKAVRMIHILFRYPDLSANMMRLLYEYL